MMAAINHSTLAYRAVVTQKMLAEASYFADRLKLPTPHPIRMTDVPGIQYPYIGILPPYFSLIYQATPPHWPVSVFGSNIYNTSIPREVRLRSLEIGVNGTFETTNFEFTFANGKLREVMRLSEPQTERYARDLDRLVGKPSLINDAQAHELATQWLAAVDVDVAALEKQFPPSVNQLHYLPRGETNTVLLPIFYVDFGLRPVHRESSVEVEILGTTKELQDLTINNLSFSRRPLLLITNILELVRTPNPPLKHLEREPTVQTNSSSANLSP
ncbi:MAG: hypothetical protein ACREFE_14160 [Limisphaerales bacterium]